MTIFVFIFFCLLFIYSLLIDYYRRSWKNIPEYLISSGEHADISVVIAVRNERENIPRLISMLRNQDYKGRFEVIIVDDHSSDETSQLLRNLSSGDNLIQTLVLPAGDFGKKKAIEKGVLAARGELIVTTDADCTLPPTWLSSFGSFYADTQAKFIAAPVNMVGGYSALDLLQCLDFLILQAITGASVYKRFHAMCNGANLAYTKQAFLDVNGFDGIDNIPSGDDMLLMYKIFKRSPEDVHYMKSKQAIVSTHAESSWKHFFHQRVRWSSKAVHFNDKKIFYVLLLTYCVNVSFLVLAVAAVFNAYWLWFLLLFLLAKILIEFPLLNAASSFFSQRRLLWFFPLMQPFHILYTVAAGCLGRFGSYEWKLRTVKNKGKGKLVKQ